VPSLVQLDEAVRSFMEENPHTEIIVVVAETIGGLAHPAGGTLSLATLSPAALTTGGFGTVGVLAVIAVLGANDVFGERALIDRLPRDVTAVASCDTTLAEIDRGLFLFLVHESPTFALGIMGALAGRLRASDEMVARLAPQASDRT